MKNKKEENNIILKNKGLVATVSIGFIILYAWLRRLQGTYYAIIQQRGVKIALQASPYGAIAVLTAFLSGASILMASLWFIGVTAVAGVAISTGIGQYFTYKYSIKYITAEAIDPLVRLLFGKDPRTVANSEVKAKLNALNDYSKLEQEIWIYGEDKLFKRNIFGMSLLGFARGLGLYSCLFFYSHPVLAVVMMLACGLQGLAYYIPAKYFNFDQTKHPTMYSEYITNAFVACGFVIVIITLLGVYL